MGTTTEPLRTLPGGLVLRAATDDDRDAIIGLNHEMFGERHDAAVRGLLDDPRVGPRRFTVVTDGDRVVSSLCLMAQMLHVGGVEVPMGQVEFVSSRPEYQRRGLVRAQFDVVHRWSEERGDLLQMVLGIPAYYRRFGYEYAIDAPRTFVLGWASTPTLPDGWLSRPAALEDLADLRRLHESAQAVADVTRARTDWDWRALITTTPRWVEDVFVVTFEDRVRSWGRLNVEDGRGWLIDAAVESREAARALLAAACERIAPPAVAFADRPDTAISAVLADLAVPLDTFSPAAYVRVADPLALLERLRPVLAARLKASVFAGERGEMVLTSYIRGILLRYADGEVTDLRPVPGADEPGHDQAGVPADLMATLILGRYGAIELERRHADVSLGQHRSLMKVLFPRLQADVFPAF
jgi:predicted N-acetyltransferase YhbS